MLLLLYQIEVDFFFTLLVMFHNQKFLVLSSALFVSFPSFFFNLWSKSSSPNTLLNRVLKKCITVSAYLYSWLGSSLFFINSCGSLFFNKIFFFVTCTVYFVIDSESLTLDLCILIWCMWILHHNLKHLRFSLILSAWGFWKYGTHWLCYSSVLSSFQVHQHSLWEFKD